MPWPPSEGNADAWEQWIKDHHASSAFNICHHQALQAVAGPPTTDKGEGRITDCGIASTHYPASHLVPEGAGVGLLAGCDKECASRNAHINDMMI